MTDHPTQFVIFTDLDGTLLDHESYSWQGAQPALARVKASGTPWVLCTSKTRAELEPLRDALDHRHPFIVENGGAILIPRGYFTLPLPPHVTIDRYEIIQFGASYPLLRRTLDEIKDASGVPIRGYGDLTVQEVAAKTGLSLEAATRAMAREYDEPFIIGGEGEGTEADRRRVLALIEAKGFQWTRGGRFHHLTGRHDKGVAVQQLSDLYRQQYGRIVTVGIGDSLNDLAMLRVVDRPILVRRPDGSYDREVALPGLEQADGIGPAGWNAAVLQLMERSALAD